MRSFNCSKCGANLTIQDENREFAFCEYCGTKIMLDDYRSTHRIIDEAKIKQAEVEREIKMKELELIEKQQIAKERKIKIKIIISLCVIGIEVILGIIARIKSETSPGASLFGLTIPLVMVILLFIWSLESGDSK